MQEEIQKYRKKEQKTNAHFAYIATLHTLTETQHNDMHGLSPSHYIIDGYTRGLLAGSMPTTVVNKR